MAVWLLTFFLSVDVYHGFVARQTTTRPLITLFVDPISISQFIDSATTASLAASPASLGALVAASTCTGILSQQPRINELNKDLLEAQAALNATIQERDIQLSELEDKVFEMDTLYEQQTAKFKKQYDAQKKVEIERLNERLKQDYQYQLEIRLDREKSDLLLKKLDDENQRTNREAKLATLRMENEKAKEASRKLETTLGEAQIELERIAKAAEEKSKGFFGWFK